MRLYVKVQITNTINTDETNKSISASDDVNVVYLLNLTGLFISFCWKSSHLMYMIYCNEIHLSPDCGIPGRFSYTHTHTHSHVIQSLNTTVCAVKFVRLLIMRHKHSTGLHIGRWICFLIRLLRNNRFVVGHEP